MSEKYKDFHIPVTIIFDHSELEEIEVYRAKFIERIGEEISVEEFIQCVVKPLALAMGV